MKRWSRRQILQASLAATGSLVLSSLGIKRWVWKPNNNFPVRILGPSFAAGHQLRDGFAFPPPSEFKKTDVLILGGGIAGLSAGWRLQKKGVKDFKILELESEVGGNSRSGVNTVSKFPWGAHYVTLLNEETRFARELFEDFGIITGYQNKVPIYNEYFLCQAPHERLFISQKWQEGLLPKVGNTEEDLRQSKAFFELTEKYRKLKGADGRFAFTIPLDFSSRDPQFLALDQITMADYLHQNGWTSKPLHWYVDYCCRDDYGTPHTQTSAWAGLHYFCSRRGRADGVDGTTVLTWPEGNGFLVDQLREQLNTHLIGESMGIHVNQTSSQVTLNVWDKTKRQVTQWTTKSLILAVPRFVSSRLNSALAEDQMEILKAISYSPWVVANITLGSIPKSAAKPSGDAPLSWDNVFYGGGSLGYVVATHQRAAIHKDKTVWTYYRPLDHLPPPNSRKQALSKTPDEWKNLILTDLSVAHPEISEQIESIDVWLWGHGMIRPTPGFIWGRARAAMQKNRGRIHFAHSDMSGISIFEEANYQGVRAADEVIQHDLG